MNTQTYRVAEGRVVVMPRSLMPGPGGHALRFEAGETFDLPDDKLNRFVRNRIRLGDIEKMAPAPSLAAAVAKKDVTP